MRHLLQSFSSSNSGNGGNSSNPLSSSIGSTGSTGSMGSTGSPSTYCRPGTPITCKPPTGGINEGREEKDELAFSSQTRPVVTTTDVATTTTGIDKTQRYGLRLDAPTSYPYPYPYCLEWNRMEESGMKYYRQISAPDLVDRREPDFEADLSESVYRIYRYSMPSSLPSSSFVQNTMSGGSGVLGNGERNGYGTELQPREEKEKMGREKERERGVKNKQKGIHHILDVIITRNASWREQSRCNRWCKLML